MMVARLHNRKHELFAVAIAEGATRCDALVAAGYPFHRGNQNRLAKNPDIIRRVEEIKRAAEGIVDLRKRDLGRILIELARIACADQPLRTAIIHRGPEALSTNQPVLHVTVRLEGALAKHIEMRLLDDRGALTALLRDNPSEPAVLDFSKAVPSDFPAVEKVLRTILRNREANNESLQNE